VTADRQTVSVYNQHQDQRSLLSFGGN